MGKRRTPTAETDTTPSGFNSLAEMLKARKLTAGTRVYKVTWPDGKGSGRTKFVVTNSPMRAAAACCHIDRVENVELIRAYSDLVVPVVDAKPPLPGQMELPVGQAESAG